MKTFVIVLLITLAWRPPSVVSTVKNVDKFNKHVDFLVDHVSGEVMILQNSGNDHLAKNIIDKINRKERTGMITIVDTKAIKDVKAKNNQMHCPRCNWIVTLHEEKENIVHVPKVLFYTIMHFQWSTASNYIIIVTNPTTLDEKKLLSHVFYLKTVKLVILFEDATNGQVRMIAPDYFIRKKMFDVKIGDDLSKVFVKKIKNLHGFQLQTAYIEDPGHIYEVDGKFGGFDGEYLNTILTALNASCEVTAKFPKNRHEYLEGYFPSGKMDINVNANFQQTMARLKNIEPLYPRDIIEIRALVPKAGMVSSLHLFFQPFSIEVWITVIIVFMALGWGWHRLNRRYSKQTLTRTEIGFQLAEMQIIQSFNLASIIVPLRFKKVFVIGFIFWSFMLSQAYQSVMIANLLEPFSYPEINIIEQLNRSGLKIITSIFFYNLSKSTYPIQLSNLIVNHTLYANALEHNLEPNTAYIMPNTDAYSVIYSEKNIKNGRPIMHLMEEVLAYTPQSYFIDKRLPIKAEIDEIMGRIRASGIDQYWKTTNFGRAEIRYKRKLAQAAEPILKMEQLKYAFYVLLIGHSVAVVVFIFELIWARFQLFLNAYFRPPIRH